MATGDIRNNLKKLQKQVSLIHYPDELDYEGLTSGNVSAHLPILYHAFFDFSSKVVENIAKLNYSLSGKKDSGFLSVVFKIMREHNAKCNLGLKVGQFMSKGFAERKIILTKDIIEFVRTSPRLMANGGRAQNRSKSVRSVTTLLGVASPTDPVAPPDVSAISVNGAHHRPQVSRIIASAPDMQSTSRNTYGHESQMQSTTRGATCVRNMVCNIKSSIEDLHSDCTTQSALPMNAVVVRHEHDLDESKGLQDFDKSVLELENQIKSFAEKQNELEAENKRLKIEIDIVKDRNEKLTEEVESIVTQQQRIDLQNIVARLDIIEAKLLTIESKQIEPPQSPVCGDNLCSHMKKLDLKQSDSFCETVTPPENSLLDVTNESPDQQHRQRGVKLLELVQGTRSLLGLGDMSGFQQNEDKEVENIAPE